jgi:hypothetical protein
VQVRDLASVEDALFVVATRGRTVEVERRLADGVKGVRVDAMAGFDGRSDASVDVSLWVRSPDDAVLFGGVGLAPATPVLRRFDGQGWSVMDTPPGVDRVVAYDRSNVGTERVFARQGEVLGLFERAAEPPVGGSREWARVPLPALGRGATVRGAWLANDDAWLLVWPPDTTIQPPRLMRMKPVVRVWTCPRRLPDDVGW